MPDELSGNKIIIINKLREFLPFDVFVNYSHIRANSGCNYDTSMMKGIIIMLSWQTELTYLNHIIMGCGCRGRYGKECGNSHSGRLEFHQILYIITFPWPLGSDDDAGLNVLNELSCHKIAVI